MKYFILTSLISFLIAEVQLRDDPVYRGNYFRRPFLHRQDITHTYKLCTYSTVAFEKCQQAVTVAKSRSLEFPLECVQKDNRNECIEAIRARTSDIVVLTGHNYKAARKAGLKPAIFERDNNEDFYIAVAPRNITIVAVNEAPIIVNQSDHRAFHAAIYFNLRRGHKICSLYNNARDGIYVEIVNSAKYTPNDEEILLCSDRSWAFFESFRECNFEASLQRAVFVNNRVPNYIIFDLKNRVFDVISKNLSHASNNDTQNEGEFNFFGTFQGQDNVIFKNNAVKFDFNPTYRNGVTEKVSNLLHCDADIGNHDSSQLE